VGVRVGVATFSRIDVTLKSSTWLSGTRYSAIGTKGKWRYAIS